MIDFDVVLKDMDGNDINEKTILPEGTTRIVPLTLGRASVNALLTPGEDDKILSGEQKIRRYELAMKVIRGKMALQADDISEIKKLIARTYGPLIVGQAWRMLDPPIK